jgi:hypothetical protein
MARQLTEQLEREVSAEELMRQTKSTAPGKTEAAPGSAPAAFDTSYTPNTPQAVTPPAASAPAPAYSPENAASVEGADWHPSPLDNKPTHE